MRRWTVLAEGGKFGDEYGEPERHRDADQHCDGRGEEGSVNWREGAELFGDRVPDVGVQERDAKGSQCRKRASDQSDEPPAEDQQHEQRKKKGKVTKYKVADRAVPRLCRGDTR